MGRDSHDEFTTEWSSVMKKSKRQIAVEVLSGLFGAEYFQANQDRLLVKLADLVGDDEILLMGVDEWIEYLKRSRA